MKKRFIVELGMGVDLHGEDQTEAACRAVKDAMGRSCLCGLMEIVELDSPDKMEVNIQVACPQPDQVDLEKVRAQAPVGKVTATAVLGGMVASGLMATQFGPDTDQIVMANAAVTVYINE